MDGNADEPKDWTQEKGYAWPALGFNRMEIVKDMVKLPVHRFFKRSFRFRHVEGW